MFQSYSDIKKRLSTKNNVNCDNLKSYKQFIPENINPTINKLCIEKKDLFNKLNTQETDYTNKCKMYNLCLANFEEPEKTKLLVECNDLKCDILNNRKKILDINKSLDSYFFDITESMLKDSANEYQ